MLPSTRLCCTFRTRFSRLLGGVLDGRRQRYTTGGGEREGEEEGRESERLSVRTGEENSPPVSEGDAGLDKPNSEASVSEKKAVAGYSFEELLEKISRAKLRRDERNFQNQHPAGGVARERNKHREKTRHVESIEELVEFLRDENATDICIIRIPPEREYVEYFVVCSGFGTRHIHTIADNLAAEVKWQRKGKGRRVSVDGRDSDDWVAVDLGFAVVHVMLDDTRQRYELEKLWTLGPKYDDQTLRMLADISPPI